jgi:hypothetical protein
MDTHVLILNALHKENYDEVILTLHNLESLDTLTATIIMEYILQNINTHFNNIDHINIIFKDLVRILNFQECTELIINKILKILTYLNHNRIQDKWSITIFKNLEQHNEILSKIHIDESIVLKLVYMMHSDVIEILAKNNKCVYSYFSRDILKFFRLTCSNLVSFSPDMVLFYIKTFYCCEISVELSELITYALNNYVTVYKWCYIQHKNIRKLVTILIHKSQKNMLMMILEQFNTQK